MNWIIGDEWKCPERGLSKKILSLQFEKVQKPTELSQCRVEITKITNLRDRSSSHLSHSGEFLLEMGTAITPIDCYIEILIQNMLLGETSLCHVQTKSDGEPIGFEITLNAISSSKYLFQLKVQEIYDLAQKYRGNGVSMFKNYPQFAHEYFCRAAKCLISYKPFNVVTNDVNGVDGTEMEALLQALQTNIAACLLQEQRFVDVIYQTAFVDALSPDDIKMVEKAVYRRALAFFNVRAYDRALATIEKVEGIQDKKEFLTLYKRSKQMWKQDEDYYKTIVQRMFN